jgi:hypothetical protein
MSKLYTDDIRWHFKYVVYDLWLGLLHRTKLIKYYISYWSKRKVGSCIRCGNCCTDPSKGILSGACKYYDLKTMSCKIYKDRPQGCKDGPISPWMVELGGCKGYKFNKGRID